MSLYLVRTDAPCKRCGDRHEYATQLCAPIFFEAYADASWLSRVLEGSTVVAVDEIPPSLARYAFFPDRRQGHLSLRPRPARVLSAESAAKAGGIADSCSSRSRT